MKSLFEIEHEQREGRVWTLALIAAVFFNVWGLREDIHEIDAYNREYSELHRELTKIQNEMVFRLACITLPREKMAAELKKMCDETDLGDYDGPQAQDT